MPTGPDTIPMQPGAAMDSLADRLERGEIVPFSPCPFTLPVGDDLSFLLHQRIKSAVHKNISYDPATQSLAGFRQRADADPQRLQRLLHGFGDHASDWLARLLPRYAEHWQRDRVTLRTEEEATRKLRLTARNDLLHFDAFPSRPTCGDRILRLFVNISPADDRVWMTSDTFATILQQFGAQVGLPTHADNHWARRIGQGILRLLQPTSSERTAYDRFMLKLHHFLKTNLEYQDRAPRRIWHFAPGAAWLLFADAVAHAELRGQFALEHSFFIAPAGLSRPDESPAALLEKACGIPVLRRAA